MDYPTFLLLSILVIAFNTLITILLLPKYYKYLTQFKKTEGTILALKKIDRIEGRYLYDLEVEFSTDYNQVRTKVSYSAIKDPEIGQKIQIRYNPQNPYEAISINTKQIKIVLFILIYSWISAIFIIIFIYFLLNK
jgi:hypothetical protein